MESEVTFHKMCKGFMSVSSSMVLLCRYTCVREYPRFYLHTCIGTLGRFIRDLGLVGGLGGFFGLFGLYAWRFLSVVFCLFPA